MTERLWPGSAREIVRIEFVLGERVRETEPMTRENAERLLEMAVRTGWWGQPVRWAILRPLVP